MGKTNPGIIEQSQGLYKQAVQEDPNLPPPMWVSRSISWLYLAMRMPQLEARTQMPRPMPYRALEIDESLPQAHAILATVYDNDWDPAAARGYQRALDWMPLDDAYAHVLYGIYLPDRGDQEQSFLHLRRAFELTP